MNLSIIAKLAVAATLSSLILGCTQSVQTENEAADLVLTNGYIYTVDAERSVAQSVAVSGNRIVAVGRNGDIEKFIGKDTRVRNLQGRLVLPGLHDAHIHALGTVEHDVCDFKGEGKSLEEMVPFLKSCLETYPVAEGDWFVAVQWPFSAGNQPSDNYPSLRAALDAVSEKHPIILWGDDGHHAAVNSVALKGAMTPEGEAKAINAESMKAEYAAFGELIGVDEQGEPNGSINETARFLVNPPSFEGTLMGLGTDPAKTMPRVAKQMSKFGITSIQDALITPEALQMYRWLEDNDEMTFRLRTALFHPAEDSKSERGLENISLYVERFKQIRKEYGDYQYIRPEAVKLFADGVLEGNPFANPPTLPNAALLDGFEQPIFAMNEDGSVDVTGYVDLDSDVCQAVRANMDDYGDAESKAGFKEQQGFFPAQCVKGFGVLEHGEQFIREFIRQTTEAGFHVHVHALADRAVRIAVDAFADNKETADAAGLTQSLAHLQVVHPEEQKRIGELELFSVFTFVWASPDPDYEMMVIPFIDQVHGHENLYHSDHYYMKNGYPAKSILDAGGILVGGSDAPVGTRDPIPFANIQQAVTRSANGHTLNSDQGISIHEAIASYTINGAKLLKQEDSLGSIEVGKVADLIVIDQNIVELAEQGKADQIAATQVLTTIFDGKVVYDK